MRSVFTADRLWDGHTVVESPVIVAEDGRIVSIASQTAAAIPGGELHAFPGLTLGPAFFDVHIHGSAGHDVMEATPAALLTIGKFLAKRGVGAYLATTVTAPMDATLRSLNGLAKLIEKAPEGAQTWPIGIHLEGPFLSHAKRGVHPPDLLLAPQIDIFDKMFEAAQGHVRLMTLAPELPGAAELAAHAAAKGVRVSVGHSNATAAETAPVLAAGATSATHTFNAMRALDHREPGILGVVLTRDDLFAELICDGIHTAPELVRLWWKAKGAERGILITDGMAAAGMPDGEYMLGGFPVQVADGRATANGVLAGSVLTLDRALKNFIEFTGATVENGLRLLGANPAAMTGFSDRAGSVAVGQPANLVVVDAAGRLVQSIHMGALV
ncbi:N-acetylglucosamine-6-phosphate deacetylase [Terracidiphilus gabretensis]|uniref:N-acetylglucosamine-6-phosphate deacetylase n=1 Tax=Terracidiphilus gabretensis TaxID=1577687 RepID=UPI00071BBC88|nr:N-acetylglucosamine-6-phosphate deacetylase [Terracidiphilus gabretensis]